MYYQNYEDYMRSVLGYPINNQNTYETNYYEYNEDNNYMETTQEKIELEQLYPDIYKKLEPYIKDVCLKCNRNLTKDNLEEITNEVYNQIYSKVENNNVGNQTNNNRTMNRETKIEQNIETRQRRPNNQSQNNQLLRDLIKILILNKIIGNRPARPPVLPPRPHFPGDMRPII